MQMKHKIIKARLKEDRVALTYVEMLDGTMKMGKGTGRLEQATLLATNKEWNDSGEWMSFQ